MGSFIRRGFQTLLALAVLASAGMAHAAEVQPFTAAAFEAAQQADKPILVEIHADWCPTCRAQAPIVQALQAEPQFAELVVFRVDFDGQKDVVRAFGAQMQSTLIAFAGTRETGRSVGDTRPDSIAALAKGAVEG